MVKKVNVYPTSPIISLDIPLRTRMMGINMDTEDIRKCIIAQAIVEEVLSDGKIVRLNFTNYDKDNSIKKEEDKSSIVDDKKEENKTEFKPIDFKNLSRKERKKLNRQLNASAATAEHKEETKVEETITDTVEDTKDEVVEHVEENHVEEEVVESVKETATETVEEETTVEE